MRGRLIPLAEPPRRGRPASCALLAAVPISKADYDSDTAPGGLTDYMRGALVGDAEAYWAKSYHRTAEAAADLVEARA